jgi:hypothetical protein
MPRLPESCASRRSFHSVSCCERSTACSRRPNLDRIQRRAGGSKDAALATPERHPRRQRAGPHAAHGIRVSSGVTHGGRTTHQQRRGRSNQPERQTTAKPNAMRRARVPSVRLDDGTPAHQHEPAEHREEQILPPHATHSVKRSQPNEKYSKAGKDMSAAVPTCARRSSLRAPLAGVDVARTASQRVGGPRNASVKERRRRKRRRRKRRRLMRDPDRLAFSDLSDFGVRPGRERGLAGAKSRG